MTRRGRGEGSITFRKDKGLWQGRIELERDAKTGQRRRRTVYAKTKAKLLEKLKEARAAPDAVRSGEVASFGELADLYLADVLARRKQGSHEHYSWMVGKLRPALGTLPLNRLTKFRLEACIAGQSTPYYRYRAHDVLKQIFLWAVRKELLRESPMKTIEAPPRPKKTGRVRYWTPEEARTFLKTAKGHRFENLFRLFLGTGLRLGEGLGVRWADVDLERGALSVTQQLVRGGRVDTPKTESSRRTIHLSPQDVKMLARMKKTATSEIVFPGLPPRRYLDRGTVGIDFRQLVIDAGVPTRTIHELRHTHATALLRAGVDIKTISERLGHASVKVTWETYAHVMPEARSEAAKLAGDLFGGK